MAISLVDAKISISEISNALLKVAKMYQVQSFDEVNALLLAEWVVERYKFKKLSVVLSAIKNPPTLYDNEGAIIKSWRLTPETLKAWIDKRSIELEELRLLEEKEKIFLSEDVKKGMPKLSAALEKEINDLKLDLMEKMQNKPILDLHEITPKRPKEEAYAVGYPHTSQNAIFKHEMHLKWIRECIDPITSKFKEGALNEREWLLEKGYFIENGEIKPLLTP